MPQLPGSMRALSRWLTAGLAAAAVAGPAVNAAAEEPMVIGSGGVTGLYFPVAGAVAAVVEAHAPDAPPIAVESTGGSMENLVRLQAGDLDLAIVRSDLQHDALNGTGAFTGTEPYADLRAVFALHPEPLTIIVRADAGITALADLPGRPINLGPSGDPTRRLFELVLGAHGWSTEDSFAEIHEVPLLDQVAALCDGRVDAIAFVAGHPSGTIHRALQACDTVPVPIDGPAVDRLLADTPALVRAAIPGGVYPGVPEAVPTVGPVATLVATEATDGALVGTLVRSVFGNLDDLRGRHPALRGLDPQAMARAGLTAPLHPAAARYYSESGLR